MNLPPHIEPAYKQVLRRCGWPTDCIVLDFETYFDVDYSLRKLSNIEYIEDERFEVLGLATLRADSPHGIPLWWQGGKSVDGLLTTLSTRYGPDLDGLTVVVQNAIFDCTILTRKYNITPKYIIDVIHLSRHLDARNRHALKFIAPRYGFQAKGDTAQFAGLRLADIQPKPGVPYYNDAIGTADEQNAHAATAAALAEYACNDVDLEWKLFKKLLPRLTRPEVELDLANHTTHMYLQPKIAFDFAGAEELVIAMEAELDNSISALGEGVTIKTIRSEAGILGLAKNIGLELPWKQGKRKRTLALAKTDQACQDLLKSPDPRVRALIGARLGARSWPDKIKRVRGMAAQSKAFDGNLPTALKYFGSHTGRWSGDQALNPQNLAARGHHLLKRVRTLMMAPPGHRFVVVDAAQIEARGLAWLAGQTDLLNAFAAGRDVYSEFASGLLGVQVRKPMELDPPPIAALMSERRTLGKIAILGAGYGLGAKVALEFLRGYPSLAAKVASGELDLIFADKLIKKYRSTYPKIPKLWHDVEKVFKHVTTWGGEMELPHMKFSRVGTETRIQLPSGRSLFYPGARCVHGELSFDHGYLWGGTTVENCLSGDTLVLTRRGLVRLDLVLESDTVWDGVAWVHHAGLVFCGWQRVMVTDGIVMTPDHGCLTTKGWKCAEELSRFNWAKVRKPLRFVLGHATDVQTGVNDRSNRQRRRLPTRELPVGDSSATGTKYAKTKPVSTYRQPRGHWSSCCVQQVLSRATFTEKVYDIMNCGPRRRFAVLGRSGKLRLVHNCTQAICRDILGEAVLRIEERYPVVLHIHDEVICVVPEHETEEALLFVNDQMSCSPEWAPDLPLASEGVISDRYAKP